MDMDADYSAPPNEGVVPYQAAHLVNETTENNVNNLQAPLYLLDREGEHLLAL